MSFWSRLWRWFLRGLAWAVSLVSVKVATWIAARAPVPPPSTPYIPGPPSDEDLIWMGKAQEARLAQLDSTRTMAKDWATSIGAITGALGIVTLIKGPEEIGRLTRAWEIAVGVALLVAVLFALRGIVLAALAAQGTPRSFSFEPRRYKVHYMRELRLAATELRVSRILVVLATLASVAAVGMTWFGDEETKQATRVYAVSTDGTTACGELSVGKGGTLLIKEDADAQPTRMEAASVRALVPTGTCP